MRTRPARPLTASLALAAVVLLSGCQRGCLSTWLRDRGAASKTATPLTMVSGVDCPDGLARCVGGSVEVSHVARIPRPCPPSSRPEDCQCPWEAIGSCPLGCTEEGTEVVTPPDRASARLCAPDPANPPARLALGLPPPPGACDDSTAPPSPDASLPPGVRQVYEGYRCIGSLVVKCSAGEAGSVVPSVLAACVRGCFRDGEALGEEEAEPEAAARILCAR